MSGAGDLVGRLAGLGATIGLDGQRLVIKAGTVPVPREIVTAIRTHKAALLALLSFERVGPFIHPCVVCGNWGAYGYGVHLREGRVGTWYCAEHRPEQGKRSGEVKMQEAA